EVWRVRPVARRSRSWRKSSAASGKPGGQPSTTQPIAGPWLSPKVVTANSFPKVLPATEVPDVIDAGRCGGDLSRGWRRVRQSSHGRSEEHTSELQSRENLVCRLLLEKKNRTGYVV